MRKFFVSALWLSSLVACQPTADQSASFPAAAPAQTGPPVRPVPATALEPPAAVAVRFFSWYQHTPVAAEFLEVAAIHPPDTTRFVVVNPKKANDYLATLRGSGCLSERFLAHMQRLVWSQSDSLHPYEPGEAVFAFDADPILDSQDGEPYLSQIGQATKTVRYQAPNRATVTVSYAKCPAKYPSKLFYVGRYPAGWLIDSLATTDAE